MTSKFIKEDLLAGFLIFLIALPLCLGIASASGFPPVAGIITAIVGGILSSILGSSRLTIKGPAAGLIVIVFAAVQELGGGDKLIGYRRTLAACVIAALLQIVISLLKGATLTQVIPLSVIHGMLSAIGVIIIIKQTPVLLGAMAFKLTSNMDIFTRASELFSNIHFEEAVIGIGALVVMFGFSKFAKGPLKKVPPQIIALLLGVLMARFEHLNPFASPELTKFFVTVPDQTFKLITFPDFSQVFTLVSLKHSVFLFLVASIESLLTVNAIDSIDPEKKTSDLNKDLFSAGAGNLAASLLGGLPMISEIVRSRANIDNGAKSASSNFFHGCFLLLSIVLFPLFLDRIPLACLASMLIFTGTRLASVREFKHAYHSGKVHFCAFLLTLLVTVFSDLLMGVILGFMFELVVSLYSSKKTIRTFNATFDVNQTEGGVTVAVADHLNFINFMAISRKIDFFIKKKLNVVVDVSQTHYIDSTANEKLMNLSSRFEQVKLVGLKVNQSL